MKPVIFVLIVCISSFSCVKKPEIIGVEQIELVNLNDSLLRVDFTMKIYNPNNFVIKISSSDIQTFYKEIPVGNGTLQSKTELKEQQSTLIKMQTQISLPNMVPLFPELLNKDTAVFNIKGQSRIKFLLANIKVNFDQDLPLNTRTIILSQIDRNLKNSEFLKIRSVSMDQLPALNRSFFKVLLDIQNNMPFPYTIKKMQIKMHLLEKGEPVATWTQDRPIIQPANTQVELPLELTVENFTLLSQLDISQLFGTEIEVFLRGNAEITFNDHAFNIPIEARKEVKYPFSFD